MAQFFTDLSEHAGLSGPIENFASIDWDRWLFYQSSWEIIQNEEISPGGDVYFWYASSTNARRAITWAGAPEAADVELYMECIPSLGSAIPELYFAARLDTSKNLTNVSSSAHMLRGGVRDASAVQFARYVNGTSNILNAATIPTLSSYDWICVRFRVNGTTLYVKAWNKSDPEPVSWQLTTPETLITGAGAVGFTFFNSFGTKRYTCFGVGTDGDPAPTSPVIASSVPVLSSPFASSITSSSIVPNVTVTF